MKKKILAVTMIVGILISMFVFTASAVSNTSEITYENSLTVRIDTKEIRTFSPSDFPEVSIKDIYYISRYYYDGYGYLNYLVIVLNEDMGDKRQEYIEKLRKNPLTDGVYYNEDVEFEPSLIPTENKIEVKVGENFDLHFLHFEVPPFEKLITNKIVFSLEDNVFDENKVYSVADFPEYNFTELIQYEYDDESGVMKRGNDFTATLSTDSYIDYLIIANKLANDNNIFSITPASNYNHTPPVFARWQISDLSILTYDMGDPYYVPEGATLITWLEDKAIFKALKEGKAIITYQIGHFYEDVEHFATATCEVVVTSADKPTKPIEPSTEVKVPETGDSSLAIKLIPAVAILAVGVYVLKRKSK